jgi:flagellar hook protein FlgE
MSLFSTLNTATTGLNASSTQLAVIGDNIANMATVGFKSARAEFADLLPNQTAGLSGPTQIGTGAGTDTVAVIFAQGAIEASENSLDMAISGDGFFMVNDGANDFYTRSGQFFLDEDGYIVNPQGYTVQGYYSTNGVLGGTVSDLQLELDPIAPKATTQVELSAILSSESEFDTTPFATGAFDLTSGNGDTLEDVASGSDFATSFTVYDSIGKAHEITVVFERTAEDAWSYYALADAGEVTDSTAATPPVYTEGSGFQIATGDLTFDTQGQLLSFTQEDTAVTTPWNFSGADPLDMDFLFGLDDAGLEADGQLRMLAGESSSSAIGQDGYPTGTLQNVSVDTDGTITGRYSNGELLTLGQVVLAQFPSNQGLDRVGNTLYTRTPDSGDPAIGVPNTGGRGKIVGNALEASNVELESEFIDMIRAQRGYQANSRVISMTDSVLNELVQLL